MLAAMDVRRRRSLRLVVALTCAVLLAGALLYTSFGSATEATSPSDVLDGRARGEVQLTGVVVRDSVERRGDTLRFRIRDRGGRRSLAVVYRGLVPDPFREGREVIVSGRMRGGVFVAERDSLITKCPSKYTKERKPAPAREPS